MKSKKRWFVVSFVTLGIVGLCVFYTTSPKTTAAYLYSPESSYSIYSSSASFSKMYSSTEDLYKDADLVAKVEVKNHRFEQNGSMVSTYSDVQLLKVYKGDFALKMVKVYEIGGLLNTAQLNLPQKDGEPVTQNGSAKQEVVENTLEGSPTMRSGNHYIVFLKKNSGQEFYNIVGSVQGKIKIDEKKNVAVGTVKEERVNKDNLYFIQKKYAGKNANDLEMDIKSMK